MVRDGIPCGIANAIHLQTVVGLGFSLYRKLFVRSEIGPNLKDAASSLLAIVAVTGGNQERFALNRDVDSTTSTFRSSRHGSTIAQP
jgi:hypothetical protein